MKFASFLRVVSAALLSLLLIDLAAAQQETDDLTICQGNDSPQASVDACTRLLDKQASERAMLLTLRALALREKGEITGAVTDLTEAIGLDDKFVPAYEARGDLLRDNSQCDLALADYDQAIKRLPERANIYLGRAQCRLDQNQPEGAVTDLDKAVELDRDNKAGLAVVALRVKAGLAGVNGDFEGALKDFDTAVALDPKQAALHVDRGQLFRNKGDLDKAIADFDEAIRLDDNNANGVRLVALVQKARLRVSRGDLDAAVTDYDEAIKLDPKSVQLYLDRARLWLQRGNQSRARQDYDDAIKADPENARGYVARADFRRDQGAFDEAIADYDQALAKQSDSLTAYGNRGLARFYAGSFGTAADDFKRVADAQAMVYPALMFFVSKSRDGDAPGAKSEFGKFATKLKAGEWPYPIVELYLGKKSLKDVDAQAKAPNEKCEANFYVGEWQLLKKEKGEATKALQAAADTCPKDFVEYRGAVEELKRLK